AVVVGGVVALVLAALFSRRVLQPVDALTAAARRMGRGDLRQRVPVSARDEIGQLGHAFNTMAEGLERTERLRRAMVTDIAHGLWRPPPTLHGYREPLEPCPLQATHHRSLDVRFYGCRVAARCC